MNTLVGKIIKVESAKGLQRILVQVENRVFSVIIIAKKSELDFVKEGNPVQLIFKETVVVLTNHFEIQTSISNQLEVLITTIDKGVLLSTVAMNFGAQIIDAILDSRMIEDLNLQQGDKVLALIPSNQIMLSPC